MSTDAKIQRQWSRAFANAIGLENLEAAAASSGAQLRTIGGQAYQPSVQRSAVRRTAPPSAENDLAEAMARAGGVTGSTPGARIPRA